MNYWEPDEYIDARIDELKNIGDTYKESLLPRWLNQPHYVEIWTEKKAMVGTFKSILGDKQVAIVPFGGYHSVSYLYNNCERLARLQNKEKEIHILYFGDVDPTGENIQQVIEDKLVQYGVYDIDFKRIAITDEQIEDFKLPTKVDADTYEKLLNDSRKKAFMKKHDDKLYQVEVDALPALKPDEFKAMILEPIDGYFDKDIYEEVLNEHSDESLNKFVNERVKFLDDEDIDKTS